MRANQFNKDIQTEILKSPCFSIYAGSLPTNLRSKALFILELDITKVFSAGNIFIGVC